MNAYFFNVTKEERENILDKHKEIYDGYVTEYAKPEEQPLYVQDFANDKKGITVNSKGDVTEYKNVGINEMKHDGKSTGLFSDEEPIDEQLDMIGDGPDDLEHGTVGHNKKPKMDIKGIVDMFGGEMSDTDKFIVFGDDEERDEFEDYFEDSVEGDPYEYIENGGFFEDIEDIEDEESIIEGINESLDMFKRFSKYN
jgi:hypothetical protein